LGRLSLEEADARQRTGVLFPERQTDRRARRGRTRPFGGPLYCAAVVFDPSYQNEEINDSKKLSPKKREALYDVIVKNALAYAIVSASVEEIDKYNILEADKRIMEKSADLD
jgi:ribonuclease HII